MKDIVHILAQLEGQLGENDVFNVKERLTNMLVRVMIPRFKEDARYKAFKKEYATDLLNAHFISLIKAEKGEDVGLQGDRLSDVKDSLIEYIASSREGQDVVLSRIANALAECIKQEELSEAILLSFDEREWKEIVQAVLDKAVLGSIEQCKLEGVGGRGKAMAAHFAGSARARGPKVEKELVQNLDASAGAGRGSTFAEALAKRCAHAYESKRLQPEPKPGLGKGLDGVYGSGPSQIEG